MVATGTPPSAAPAHIRSHGHAAVPRAWLRCQPPVLSPVSAGALVRATRNALAHRTDAVSALRQRLMTDYEADVAVLTGSGTQALQLAIEAAFAEARARTVALPAFGCYDLASAAVGVRGGAHIMLYDVDPITLAPRLESLEATFRHGASVAVVAPLYGFPSPWQTLADMAAAHGVILIEDAAQGHGARWEERPLGSIGAISVLSFGRGKGWTGGAGGALLGRGAAPMRAVQAIGSGVDRTTFAAGAAAFARVSAQWLLTHPLLYSVPASLPWLGLGETRYHDPTQPHELPETAAALALATHGDALHEADARRERATRLRARVAPFVQNVEPVPGALPGYLRLPVRVRRCSALAAAHALRRLGGAASYPATLNELTAVQPLLRFADARVWPGAAALARELITLPTHSLLTPSEIDRIVATIAQL